VLKKNPDIFVSEFSNHYNTKHSVELANIGYKIAFGVNDYRTGKPYDDPNFVEWTVRVNEYINQQSVSKVNIAFHKCTLDDYQ
jgi:hypothetical protein